MNMSYIKYFIVSLMFLTLTGCKEPLSYSYLMRHPQVLKKEIDNCQDDELSSTERAQYCRMIMFAAENMLSYLKQQQESPENFGNRLLSMEMKVAKTKLALREAQKVLNALLEKDSADKELRQAKEKRDELKTLYKEQCQEMKVMLAVIGINTPE